MLFLALMACVVGFVAWHYDARNEAKEQTVPTEQSILTDLSRMPMAQAVAHCRMLWKAWHYDQAPLAVAWHKDGVDWYVLEGVDKASMRHFGCDGDTVSAGQRFERTMKKHVSAPTPQAPNIVSDINLFDYLASLPDTGLRAIEVAENPATLKRVERRWTSTGGVQSDWPDTEDFPILFRYHPTGLAIEAYPLLKALPTATNWVKNPMEVFTLLERHLPPDARIAELNFNDKTVNVTINGPIKNFDNKPPAPFGAATFDEYGIRQTAYWYPYDQTGSSCAPGVSLASLAAKYAEERNGKHPELFYAKFSCKSAQLPVSSGSWYLNVPKRRR